MITGYIVFTESLRKLIFQSAVIKSPYKKCRYPSKLIKKQNYMWDCRVILILPGKNIHVLIQVSI